MTIWTDQDREKFHSSILRIVKETFYADAALTDNVVHAAADDWKSTFRTEKLGIISKLTVEECISLFELWLLKQALAEKRSTSRKLSAQISKNYGAVVVTFGTSESFEILSSSHERMAYELMLDSINAEFAYYEAERLPRVNIGNADGPEGVGRDDLDVFPAIRLNVSMKSGKYYYNVTGGRWMKHGVLVWPEALKMAEIDIDAIPTDGLDLKGYTAWAQMDGTNPKKIVRLEKIS